MRIFLTALLILPSLLLPIGATDPPANDKAKTKSVFCPVVGLPDCRTCGCPSGYCPTRPDKELTTSFEGGKLMFCCGKCQSIFVKDPQKFAANAHHQLVATGQARQQKCPLCGGDKGVASLDIGGVTVNFCSTECRDKASKAAPAERMELIFGQTAFTKAFTASSTRN